MYVLMITYNFDGGYEARKCEKYNDAVVLLNTYLKEEIETVKRKSGYMPSVLKWDEDDITLVYAEGYTLNTEEKEKRNYASEDCAYYRIFQI